MKACKNRGNSRKQYRIVLLSFLVISFIGCKSDEKKKENSPLNESPIENTSNTSEKTSNAIEVITRNMEFFAPNEISSGWNTFRYKNYSSETHFLLLEKYPEGKSIKDTKADVMPYFDSGMELINKGKNEEGFAEFNKLPAWFFEVVDSGGSGLISPGQVSETTVNLAPGNYLMECYVKMPSGQFHSSMGMAKEIIVTESVSINPEPTPTSNINISSTEGITFNTPIIKGKHTFSVHFKDQIRHEIFLGHDVHIVRLSNDANLDSLENWMNWVNPKGLITPAPKGVTFLGGLQDMPAGSTGYFKVDVTPGNYAFISEVPETAKKGMLKPFSVTE